MHDVRVGRVDAEDQRGRAVGDEVDPEDVRREQRRPLECSILSGIDKVPSWRAPIQQIRNYAACFGLRRKRRLRTPPSFRTPSSNAFRPIAPNA